MDDLYVTQQIQIEMETCLEQRTGRLIEELLLYFCIFVFL